MAALQGSRSVSRALSAKGRRGPGRAHAWSSGAIVLGLFAWFALTACFFESKDDPATTGRDTVYGDTSVHHGPDGGTVYGDFHCDPDNRYLGGGDAASVANTRRNLEAAISRLEREIEDVDRQRDQCKGRTKSRDAYLRERNCDSAAVNRAEQEANDRHRALDRARNARGLAEVNRDRVKERLQRRLAELGGASGAGEDPYVANLRDQLQKRNAEVMHAVETERSAESAYRTARNTWEELGQRWDDCSNRAYDDAKADPCSDLNYLPIAQRWNQLRNQLAMYERDLERLKDCDENRAAQVGGRPSQPGVTISPGLLLGPWLQRPPTGRPPPRHPHGSPPP